MSKNAIKVKIENTDHLTRNDRIYVEMIASSIESHARSLAGAKEWLKELRGFFIYEGGSHIALHLHDLDPKRILLVTEA